MKLALFGASGTLGRRILLEALNRGHDVTAVVRKPSRLDVTHDRLTIVAGDARDAASVARAVAGQDAVVDAIGPGHDQPVSALVDAAGALLQGLERAGVRRLLVVGGAGSLEVAPGVQLMHTAAFPEAWRPVAKAHADALDVYRGYTGDVDWTYVSPAAFVAPGERTGRYRTGTDRLVTDSSGESRISAEDFAIAVIDEVEEPQFSRRRFTVAN